MNPEKLKREMKLKKNRSVGKTYKNNSLFIFMTKFLITALLTLILLIGTKQSPKLKQEVYKHVYDTNFSFAYFNQLYQKTFGSPMPFSNFLKEPIQATFKEKLTYKKQEAYKEGVKLSVAKEYLVPIKNSGLVVFVGEKEGYGNTVIIGQMDGIDLWYGNLKEVNVKLYDYVEEGSLLGEALDQTLYLVFKKEGTALDYKEYLQ